MKKQNKREALMVVVAVVLLSIIMGLAIMQVINNIDLTPRQIYTFEGVQWECSFSAVGEMEGCHQVDDPDVGFGRIP